MSDLYEYNDISEESKQFAIDTLNENPLQVIAHIKSFRRWVTSMPHLKCPTDSKFLLRFLRVAKFDHKKAEKRLDNFCTVRSSLRGCPQYFDKIDDRIIDIFLDSQMHIILGKNDNGELIILTRAKQWDPEAINANQLSILFHMIVDMLVSEEETQIHGLKLFLDLGGVSRKLIEAWSDPTFLRNHARILQDCVPMRLKGLICCNESALLNIFFTIMIFFMNNKLKQRFYRLKNDMQEAEENNPGLTKILPTEYGGLGGSINSLGDKFKDKFKAYYKNGYPLACISVDESKRPPESSNFLREYQEYKGETLGTEGTFTKYDDVL